MSFPQEAIVPSAARNTYLVLARYSSQPSDREAKTVALEEAARGLVAASLPSIESPADLAAAGATETVCSLQCGSAIAGLRKEGGQYRHCLWDDEVRRGFTCDLQSWAWALAFLAPETKIVFGFGFKTWATFTLEALRAHCADPTQAFDTEGSKMRALAMALQSGWIHRRFAALGFATTEQNHRYAFITAPGLRWTAGNAEAHSSDAGSSSVTCIMAGCSSRIDPDFVSMVAHVTAVHAQVLACEGGSLETAMSWMESRIRKDGSEEQRAVLPADIALLTRRLKEPNPLERQLLDAEAAVASAKTSKRQGTSKRVPDLDPQDMRLLRDGCCVMQMPSCELCCAADGGSKLDAKDDRSREYPRAGATDVCLEAGPEPDVLDFS
ncbi:unnamed protein product [Parajaminaea phylloscopi]